MNGAYLFESAKCMALTLQLIQGNPVSDPAAEQGMDPVLSLNEYRTEVKRELIPVTSASSEDQASVRGQGDISRESLLDFYEQLALLRKDPVINRMLTSGEFRLAAPEDAHVFAYEREFSGRRLLIAANWSKENQIYALDKDFECGDIRVSVYPEVVLSQHMLLRPYEAFAVLI